jgi:hypothetical protein
MQQVIQNGGSDRYLNTFLQTLSYLQNAQIVICNSANCLNDILKAHVVYPDFRPTGATVQVEKGVELNNVMQVGRWKLTQCFLSLCKCTNPDNVLL